jgi:hypothetical protein
VDETGRQLTNEVQITPEMIEAGKRYAYESGVLTDPLIEAEFERLLAEVFRIMDAERPRHPAGASSLFPCASGA